MTACVTDTHALVWYLTGSKRLGRKAAEVFELPEVRIVIPTTVLAELKYLHQRSRIPLSLSVVERLIAADQRCLVFPMTEEVVRWS